MRITDRLTLQHLKANKGRTVITVLGISVSVAMLTMVIVAAASLLNMLGETVIHNVGNYHFWVNATQEQVDDLLLADSDIAQVSKQYVLDNSIAGYNIEYGRYKHASIGSWYVGDKDNLRNMITCAYEGSIPENSHEILVEQELIDNNGLDWKTGDIVEITSGFRYKGDESFFRVPVNGAYSQTERFDKAGTDKYKIVGILYNNCPTRDNGSFIIRGADDSLDASIRAYVLMNKVGPTSFVKINNIIDRFGYDSRERVFNCSVNSTYLESRLAVDKESDVLRVIIPICAIVLLLIMIASAVLIYNAFSMSFNERVRYLGMLSSVGATRRQNRDSVFFETALLGSIGIITGIASGIATIGIVLSAFGNKLAIADVFNLADGSVAQPTTLVVPPLAIISVILLSIITLVISAIIPLRNASDITPIDAIRSSNIYTNSRRIRAPRLIRLVLGYEGELAHKNLKRNGSKSAIITGSIILSVVLFLCCSYTCDTITRSGNLDADKPYQIDVHCGNDEETDYNKILTDKLDEMSNVKDYFSILTWQYDAKLDSVSRDILEEIFNSETLTPAYRELKERASLDVVIVEDDAFIAYCKKNNIDYKKYFTHKKYEPYNVVLMNNVDHKDNSRPVFTDAVKGARVGTIWYDSLKVYYDMLAHPENYDADEIEEDKELNRKMYDFRIGDLAQYDKDNYICNLKYANSVVAFCPRSTYEYGEFYSLYYPVFSEYGLVTDEHAAVTKELKNFSEDNELGVDIIDDQYYVEKTSALLLLLKLFVYGFIFLISLITLFNVINTISTGVALRKKEFAMLRSVGTTPKGFRKMIMLESAFYGLRALIVALPLSIGISYAINHFVTIIVIPFRINVPLYIAVTVVVFAIIALTMLYSVRKTESSSIIDALREDIT